MRPTWRPALLLATAAGLTLGACSAGGGSATPTTLDQAQAVTDVTNLFTTVFTGAAGSVAHKVDLVQDSNSIRPALEADLGSPQSRSSTIRVNEIDLLTPEECQGSGVAYPCARVTNDILVNGRPFLVGEKSYAVRVGGRWEVAKLTMCDLLAMPTGHAPPGC